MISVKVMEPQFEGQTKTKLGNKEVSGAVDKLVGEMLTNFLEEHPNEAKMIVQKVLLAARARVAAKKARERVQRKGSMSSMGLPGKLSDCSETDPEVCEIFLVEEILQGVRPNKVATVTSRQSFRFVVRS